MLALCKTKIVVDAENCAALETCNIGQESNMYIQLTAIILTCIGRDCGENLACLTMHDVADVERFEWRWRLTRKRIDVLNVTRRKYCYGGISYASGSTAYKIV